LIFDEAVHDLRKPTRFSEVALNVDTGDRGIHLAVRDLISPVNDGIDGLFDQPIWLNACKVVPDFRDANGSEKNLDFSSARIRKPFRVKRLIPLLPVRSTFCR
jgi:hypothetical protein